MLSFNNPALPTGSRILVTGVNGLIGSHVADQVLSYSYKVRGTVRSLEENSWMVPFFEDKFGTKGIFELVEVHEMAAEGAFDEAMKGVSGVIHVASIVNTDPDAQKVVDTVVAGTLGILHSAAKEDVKRFVLTSSADAAHISKPNNPVIVTTDTWNEEAVQLAFNPPAEHSEGQRGLKVYSASKVKGEQALWKWVDENKKSDMVINSVLPGGNFGKILSPKNQGHRSTTALAAALYNNRSEIIEWCLENYKPEWFVDVQDCARLHVAALLHQGVVNERVFAWAEPFSWNVVLEKLRKMFPEREFVSDKEGLWVDLAVVEPARRAEGLLREMGRVGGYTSLEESLRGSVESC